MAPRVETGIALDCSAALALFLDDETPALAAALLDALPHREFRAPMLWRCEFANALLVAQRKRRLTPTAAQRILAQAARLPLQFDDDPPSAARLFEIAAANGLTAYDAAYFELAQRHGLELATLDQALARAAQRTGIALFRASPVQGVHEPRAAYRPSRREPRTK